MPLARRQAAMMWMWILVSILVTGACSKEFLSAGDENPNRSQLGSRPSTQSVPPGSYEGFLDAVSCDGLGGWAWTPAQPARPMTIDLYDGDRLLVTTRADQLRQDLRDAGKGNGRHGFVEAVPPEIKDGKPHSIRAVVNGASFALQSAAGVPSSVTCAR